MNNSEVSNPAIDRFIHDLFVDTFQKMGINKPRFSSVYECRLVIDHQHPIMLSYDRSSQKVILLNILNLHNHKNKVVLQKHILYTGLNPLISNDPGAGIDQESGLCFIYLTISQHTATADILCEKIAQLVRWTKDLIKKSTTFIPSKTPVAPVSSAANSLSSEQVFQAISQLFANTTKSQQPSSLPSTAGEALSTQIHNPALSAVMRSATKRPAHSNPTAVSALFKQIIQSTDSQTLPQTANSNECRVLLRKLYPIVLHYVASQDKIMLISLLQPQQNTDTTQFQQQILHMALNPLHDQNPGAGLDEKSCLYFSYLALTRRSATEQTIITAMEKLIFWGRKIQS